MKVVIANLQHDILEVRHAEWITYAYRLGINQSIKEMITPIQHSTDPKNSHKKSWQGQRFDT
jgi:hypothetical protein